MTSSLELVRAIRPFVRTGDKTFKSERNFLDFLVDGESLWTRVKRQKDLVSILCAEFDFQETQASVRRLLLQAPSGVPNGRSLIFICAECGDLGCGAITLRIEKRDSLIIWKELGYENSYQVNLNLNEYKDVGPFAFEYRLYEQSLLHGLDSLREFRKNQALGRP